MRYFCIYLCVSQWHLCCIRVELKYNLWGCSVSLGFSAPGHLLSTSCNLFQTRLLSGYMRKQLLLSLSCNKSAILQKWILCHFPSREVSGHPYSLLVWRQTRRGSPPSSCAEFVPQSLRNTMLKRPFLPWLVVFYNKQSQPPSVPIFFFFNESCFVLDLMLLLMVNVFWDC